ELPKLPRPGGDRRPPWPRPHRGRHATDPRPVDRPGEQWHARWRQHAGVRQTNEPGRDDRPRCLSRRSTPDRRRDRSLGGTTPGLQAIPMSPTLEACLRSWPFDPWLLATMLVTAGLYLRGWRLLRRRDGRRWQGRQAAAFLGGLAVVYVALASPID